MRLKRIDSNNCNSNNYNNSSNNSNSNSGSGMGVTLWAAAPRPRVSTAAWSRWAAPFHMVTTGALSAGNLADNLKLSQLLSAKNNSTTTMPTMYFHCWYNKQLTTKNLNFLLQSSFIIVDTSQKALDFNSMFSWFQKTAWNIEYLLAKYLRIIGDFRALLLSTLFTEKARLRDSSPVCCALLESLQELNWNPQNILHRPEKYLFKIWQKSFVNHQTPTGTRYNILTLYIGRLIIVINPT